jgi:hypothetical protein
MNIHHIAAGLFLAVAIATPASANWFDNYMVGENHKKLVGSAPTPTPDDLRATGDSPYGAGKSYHFNQKSGHWNEVHPIPGDKASGSGSAPPDSKAAVAPELPARR